jgi:hypothetical protein
LPSVPPEKQTSAVLPYDTHSWSPSLAILPTVPLFDVNPPPEHNQHIIVIFTNQCNLFPFFLWFCKNQKSIQ